MFSAVNDSSHIRHVHVQYMHTERRFVRAAKTCALDLRAGPVETNVHVACVTQILKIQKIELKI